MREVIIGLIFLGIAIAIIVGVLWVSFSYLPEREHHNARPTPPAAIWSSGSAKRSTSRASKLGSALGSGKVNSAAGDAHWLTTPLADETARLMGEVRADGQVLRLQPA
jgi:hypothetical protein